MQPEEISRPGRMPLVLALEYYLDLSDLDVKKSLVCLFARRPDGTKEYLNGWFGLCDALWQPMPEVRR